MATLKLSEAVKMLEEGREDVEYFSIASWALVSQKQWKEGRIAFDSRAQFRIAPKKPLIQQVVVLENSGSISSIPTSKLIPMIEITDEVLEALTAKGIECA